jgi:hypothetical protein
MSSLLKVSPGIRPLFFSQKMDAKLPEKKIPSTAAKATTLSPKVAELELIQFKAQSAFFFTQGKVSMALNKYSLQAIVGSSFLHLIYHEIIRMKLKRLVPLLGFLDVGVDEETVHLRVNVFNGDLEAIKTPGFGDLHFLAESLNQILVDNSVRCSKKGKDVRNKVTLILSQCIPVLQVLNDKQSNSC